ncbi:MAG: HEPN domain-containing protein [Tetrasphaera sp.]
MTWAVGRDKVSELLTSGELDTVPTDLNLAGRLLAEAAKHVGSARRAQEHGDLTGAYQLAYDALRKAAAALLAAQGLRATSRGGHIAIQDTVSAQFGGPGSPFKSFGRIRRNRNRFEYPDSDTVAAHHEDVDDALSVADAAVLAVEQLLGSGQVDSWV